MIEKRYTKKQAIFVLHSVMYDMIRNKDIFASDVIFNGFRGLKDYTKKDIKNIWKMIMPSEQKLILNDEL